MPLDLSQQEKIFVRQRFEMAELFGFETRNRFGILDEKGQVLAYAAEQQKGLSGFFFRQMFGHWRSFDINFYDNQRNEILMAHHPFRFFFRHLDIYDENGRLIGYLQQRFSWLSKKFDVCNSQGKVVMEVNSPFFSFWKFPFYQYGHHVATVQKKWSGGLYELFTDRDNFLVEFVKSDLKNEYKHLVLAASIFIDLLYFERKAN